MDTFHAPTQALSGVIVVLLVDYLAQHRAWGWLRLAQGPASLRDTPGLLFAKVMGSGQNGGFSLRPSSTHQGLVCMFETQHQAELFIQSPQVQAYRDRSRECWVGMLDITSVRGAWDRQTWGVTPASSLHHPVNDNAPIAALTRASIRPAKAMAFWRRAPASQTSINQAAGCLLAMGLGEAPLIRQCTFSVWRDTSSMLQFAHQGAHHQAIQAAYKQEFFSESLFVRMRVLSMQGDWQGHHFDNSPEMAHV